MAWIAEVVRNRRRLTWLAVPTVALAAIVVVARTADKPWGPYDDLPHVEVRSRSAALPPELVEHRAEGSGLVVRGRVLDEQERPVVGATVLLEGQDVAHTKADGTFTVRDVATYGRLLVRNEELTTGHEWLWGRHPDDAEQATLKMRRGATIVVHAVELDGTTPIAGAKIALDEFKDGVTGADGTVTFHNIDRVWVTASAPGHGAVSCSLDNWKRSKDGQHWVTLPKGAAIAGVVLDPQGRPVPYASVDVSTIETSAWHRDPTPIRADEHGAWRLEGLAPGTYGLTGYRIRIHER
jgi:hypothetical protein